MNCMQPARLVGFACRHCTACRDRTAPHCNALQSTAPHCTALHRTALQGRGRTLFVGEAQLGEGLEAVAAPPPAVLLDQVQHPAGRHTWQSPLLLDPPAY